MSNFFTSLSYPLQQITITETASLQSTGGPVTRTRADEILGAVAPIVSLVERAGDGVLVFPLTFDGTKLARLFEAQLTLCAAGLWPASAVDTEAERLRIELKDAQDFADLWCFVSDEAPLEFEAIVTGHVSSRWLDETFKLRASKRR